MSEPTRYVVGFLFSGDEVLLIEKRRPTWQAGRLNGVGGHVEIGESFLDAMRREFAEETGWGFDAWEHFATLCGDDRDSHRQGAHAGTTFEVAFFCGRTDEPELPDVHPTDEPPRWARAADLPATVLPNLRWLIPLAWHAHRADWPLLVTEHTLPLAAGAAPPRREPPEEARKGGEPVPAEVFPVSVLLVTEMFERDWTRSEVAQRMGGNFVVNSAVLDFIVLDCAGDLLLGEDVAAQLEVAFGISAETWLRTDETYRKWRAARLGVRIYG